MIEIIISSVCAIISLIATIIIAVVQYKQGKRMEELALRQDKEEKQRRNQRIVAERNSFIMKYHGDTDEINLLPLCWIASIYNPTFHYNRKMYMEFNMLEQDVQDAICEYMNFKVAKPNITGYEFYNQCVDLIQSEEKKYYNGESHFTLFYDKAKYLYRCLDYYKSKELPIDLYELEHKITDYICSYMEDKNKCPNPIEKYSQVFGFCGAEEPLACEICAVAAKWVAEWNHDDNNCDYWIPGGYGYETLDTLEDLFLCTLLCIYIYLITKDDKGKEI